MLRLSVKQWPMIGLLPGVLSVASLLLVILVLVAGINNALTSVYFLKTDTSKLSVPAKLAGSSFLQGLSDVSKTDYVGPPATASSLGIADSYTIHLLTFCGHFPGGTVSCSKPSIGFAFHPGSSLRLDGTALQGSYSDELLAALSQYSRLSRYLAGAYIASALFLGLTLVASCISAATAAFTSSIAAVVLFTATVASGVVFGTVNSDFNDSFDAKTGLSSAFGGKPIALSVVAFLLALFAAVSLMVGARKNAYYGSRVGGCGPLARSVGGKNGGEEGVAGADPYAPQVSGKKGGGILARVVPLFPGQKHKYVQVEAQPALVRTDANGRQRELDEDWGARDSYSGHVGGKSGRSSPAPAGDSVPLVVMGGNNNQGKGLDKRYEPYSSQTEGKIRG